MGRVRSRYKMGKGENSRIMKLRQALNEGKMAEKVFRKLSDHHVEKQKKEKSLRIVIQRMINAIDDSAELQEIHNSLDLNDEMDGDIAEMLYIRGEKLGARIQ